MPLAILTDARVTLLDALGKRIRFLQEVIDALPLDNAQAVHARAEEFGHREAFDLAVSRAVQSSTCWPSCPCRWSSPADISSP